MLAAGSKCRRCTKTAYPQESLTYDSYVWHKSCFRCMSCESTLTLRQVAMIRGDVYCKTCFMRMFSEKGSYHVFGEKTLPKHMLSQSVDLKNLKLTENASATEAPAAAPSPASAEPVAPATVAPATEAKGGPITKTPSFERRASVIKMCAVAECKNLRVGVTSYCAAHAPQHTADDSSNVQSLLAAIAQRSVDDVKKLLESHGAELALDTSGQQSPIEVAFTSGSVACGKAMVEALAKRVGELTAEVKDLQEEKDEAENNFILMDSDRSPRSGSNAPAEEAAPASSLEVPST